MAKVIIYTQNGCAPCLQEKAWLKENGVEFEERNLSLNRDYIDDLLNAGARSTPVTFVGDEMVIGFDRERLSSLLNLQR